MKLNFFKARDFTRHKAGFTLIELMVVIAIIGILASIISVSLSSSRAKGRDAKRVADIRTLQLSLEQYYNDNSSYPATLSALAPTYISVIPKDPKDNTTSYLYSAYNSVPSATCTTTNKPVRYHLAAVMEIDSTGNSVLNQDSDYNSGISTVCSGTTPDFNGLAASCVGTTAAVADNCYDVTNP